MMWDSMNEEASDIAMDCSSFQQMSRNALAGGAASGNGAASSRRLNMDLDGSLHEMAVDELSFFEDEEAALRAHQRSFAASPPPLQGLLSPEGSPRRFQVVERTSTAANGSLNAGQKILGRQQKLFHQQQSTLGGHGHNGISSDAIHSIGPPMATPTRRCAPASANGSSSNSKSFRMFHSLSTGSMESSSMEDDEFMELLEMESLEQQLMTPGGSQALATGLLGFPSDLSSLISGQIKSASPALRGLTPRSQLQVQQQTAVTPLAGDLRRPSVRRCLSMTEQQSPLPHLLPTHMQSPKTPELLKPVKETVATPIAAHMPFSPRMANHGPAAVHHHHPANNATTPSSANANACFKRPDPPSTNNSPVQSKRYRHGGHCASAEQHHHHHRQHVDKENLPATMPSLCTGAAHARPLLRKCVSMNDAEIMSALARSDCKDEPDLIGDFSKPFVLPLMAGRHQDLKSISSDTVARLLAGDFDDAVADYLIVDCRYPYEYDGGHIRGAKNLYTQEQIIDEFLSQPQRTIGGGSGNGVVGQLPRRNIIIFHCEFSSERGPKLSRFLRNTDRARNTSAYPTLDYPEIYLLHNGYKAFYEAHADLCEPVSYRPMLEPSYSDAYRHFRAKSKSWNGDGMVAGLGGTTVRSKKPRSRLML